MPRGEGGGEALVIVELMMRSSRSFWRARGLSYRQRVDTASRACCYRLHLPVWDRDPALHFGGDNPFLAKGIVLVVQTEATASVRRVTVCSNPFFR